jgi:hypothetical protein
MARTTLRRPREMVSGHGWDGRAGREERDGQEPRRSDEGGYDRHLEGLDERFDDRGEVQFGLSSWR